MINTISTENIFMKIPGISNFFKPTREPHKDLEEEFKNSEKMMKDKGSKLSSSLDAVKFSNITAKLVLWNYNSKLTPTAKKYMSEIESTGGVYSKRDSRIRQSVYSMYAHINDNYKPNKASPYLMFDVFTRIYKILNDQKWSKAFNTAYKFHKKGVDSASIIFMEYQFLVYTIESLTLMMREYTGMLMGGQATDINIDICKKYVSFTTSVCKNIVKIIAKCEHIKDPSGYVNNTVKIEKRYEKGQESEFFKIDKPEPDGISEESAVGVALLYGGLVIISTVAIINSLRYIIYSLSCLVVDISKSLIDQSYVLLVNIETLEAELAKTKEGTREYKELKKIIERQKQLTEKLISIANKLSDTDMKSIDEIRNKEYDDNNTIESSIDDEDDNSGGNMDGGFDI